MNADTDRNIALPSPPASDVDAIDILTPIVSSVFGYPRATQLQPGLLTLRRRPGDPYAPSAALACSGDIEYSP